MAPTRIARPYWFRAAGVSVPWPTVFRGQVAGLVGGLHDVQGGQCAARTHHRSGEIGGRADGGRCLHPHGDRVARTGARHVISNFYLTE